MISIIGGSGFVGTKLISVLSQNNCHNIDKNPSHFFKTITTIGNICNPEQIKFDKKSLDSKFNMDDKKMIIFLKMLEIEPQSTRRAEIYSGLNYFIFL